MTVETETSSAPAQTAGWRGKFAGFALALSLFAILWFAAAAVGTKLGLWNWQFGLGVMTITWGPLLLMAAAGISVLAVIVSLIKSPRKQAFMLAFAALLISGLAFGRVAAFGGQVARLPPLHDIQTDWSNPILPSDVLLTAREFTGALNPIEADPVIDESANARWPGMGGRRVAEVQEEAEFDSATHKSPKETPYPLIAPLTAPVTVEAAYEAALAAVEGRGWTVVTASLEDGTIEATETSFWFGFHDDIMIRILSGEDEVVIDVRSTSRVGLSDLGANAKRIRNLLDEIETRLNKVV
jgi:fatty-acyl-CoA synthase